MAEADRLCNAQRYKRSEARRDTRAGHYERGLPALPGMDYFSMSIARLLCRLPWHTVSYTPAACKVRPPGADPASYYLGQLDGGAPVEDLRHL